MTKEAVKVLGTQLKTLLERAVGGIYTSKEFQGIVTDYYEKYRVTEKALEIKRKDATALVIIIDETKQYINYAISGEDFETKEAWEGSTFFDYQFYLDGYMICFSVVEKGTRLTWAQFQELTSSKDNAFFEVRSKDTSAFYLAVDNCTIDMNDREIEINSNKVNVIIDRDIIDALYNDSTSVFRICYRLKFNNGMPDIFINIENKIKI